MEIEDKLQLILSVAAPNECLTPEELRQLLTGKQRPIAYDGFEPSGRIHLAQVSNNSYVLNFSDRLLIISCESISQSPFQWLLNIRN